MSRFYAGIGSRETPQHILKIMTKVASSLEQIGYTLRSGAAAGADSAFEQGVRSNKEIFLPWSGFNDRQDGIVLSSTQTKAAEEVAKQFHGGWSNLSRGAKALHTRNVAQVLGADINSPSEFLLLWALPMGKFVRGGTGQAVRIASHYNIPWYNLYYDDVRLKIERWINE